MVKRKRVKFITVMTVVIALILATIGLAACDLSPTGNPTDADCIYRNFVVADDETIVSQASLSDSFYTDSVYVVLTQAASFDFGRTFTPKDFMDTGIASVTDLTERTGESVRRRMLRLRDDSNIQTKPSEFRRILRLELIEQTKENVLYVVELLQQHPEVRSATPNFRTFSSSAGVSSLIPSFFEPQLTIDRIQLPRALSISRRFTNTVAVGVVENNAIAGNHPSLAGQIHRSTPHNINTTLHRLDGQSQLNPEPYRPRSNHTHPTQVAGVLASMSPNIRLVSLDSNQSMPEMILFANGRIPILTINIYMPNYNAALAAAIAQFSGLLVVSANNYNRSYNLHYPANFTQFNDRMIVVGATTVYRNASGDIIERRAQARYNDAGWCATSSPGSNWGPRVHIFAPGTDIRTTCVRRVVSGALVYDYYNVSGTSFSTPMVAGVSAKLLSINPNLTRGQLRQAIVSENSTDEVIIGQQPARRLNAYKAVKSQFNMQISNCRLFEYFIYNNGAVLHRHIHYSSWFPVTIPNILGGFPVREINCLAFYENLLYRVVVSSNVRFIGYRAFANNDLQFVRFCEFGQLREIREKAFFNNRNIGNIVFPKGLEYIGDRAFELSEKDFPPFIFRPPLYITILRQANQGVISLGQDVFRQELAEIVVPTIECVAVYRTAVGWHEFSNIIVPYSPWVFVYDLMSYNTNGVQIYLGTTQTVKIAFSKVDSWGGYHGTHEIQIDDVGVSVWYYRHFWSDGGAHFFEICVVFRVSTSSSGTYLEINEFNLTMKLSAEISIYVLWSLF